MDSSYMVVEGYKVERDAVTTLRMAYHLYSSLHEKPGDNLSWREFIRWTDTDEDNIVEKGEANSKHSDMVILYVREN